MKRQALFPLPNFGAVQIYTTGALGVFALGSPWQPWAALEDSQGTGGVYF
jgi:hypothetical protein